MDGGNRINAILMPKKREQAQRNFILIVVWQPFLLPKFFFKVKRLLIEKSHLDTSADFAKGFNNF